MFNISNQNKNKNKNMEWKKRVVGKATKKLRKRYLTKGIRIKRAKLGILLGSIILASTICWFYPEYSFKAIQDDYSDLNSRNEQLAKSIIKVKISENNAYETICKATNGENCDVIYNLCKAESGCKQYAVNFNTNNTYDYSWFQINSVHIIEQKSSKGKGTINFECVYDLSCSAKWVNEKIKQNQLHIWVASSKI